MSADRIRVVAVAALLQVAADPEAPASARAQAATALLTLIGDIGSKSVPLKARELADLTALSSEEMQAELAALDVDPPTKGRKRNRS